MKVRSLLVSFLVALFLLPTASACLLGIDSYMVTYQVGETSYREMVPSGEFPQRIPALPEGYMGWREAGGRFLEPEKTEIRKDQTFTAFQLPGLNGIFHSKFMGGAEDGLFYPDRSITRAEAAQVICNLFSEESWKEAPFTDVAADAWYARPIGTLTGLGLIVGEEEGRFYPDRPITRGEFAQLLSFFVPAAVSPPVFSDVPKEHPAYEGIAEVAAAGIFGGYPDGGFHPEEPLTRAACAAAVNRLLNRVPDEKAIASAENLRIFPDVPTSHWAYGEIMEATVSHEYSKREEAEAWTWIETEKTVLPEGYHNIDGWLYRVKDGSFLRSVTEEGFTFDADGRYTTGLPELDRQLAELVRELTAEDMTQEQKLRILYNYVRDNFTYLKRDLVQKGETGWEPAYAEEFFRLGKGNCYSFSAAFCLLARQLGLPAYTVVGGLGRTNSPHGWVEIPLDGTNYMFDPQLDWRYLHDYGRKGYDFFKMDPDAPKPVAYVR